MVDRLHFMSTGIYEAGVVDAIRKSAYQNGYTFTNCDNTWHQSPIYSVSKTINDKTIDIGIRIKKRKNQ